MPRSSSPVWSDLDIAFMRRALDLSVLGHPSPNPYAGAVLVKSGKIIGEGYHSETGESHAEIEAINSLMRKYGKKAPALLAGSSLYVTLEPCSHYGRTPPCTHAILAHKIRRVVYAMADPNKAVKGHGGKILSKAGIQVFCGLLEERAKAINAAFISRCLRNRPLLTLKMAMSLDGKCATKTGDSKWISSSKSLEMAHQMRSKCGAILVGVGTVINDNPRLTARPKKKTGLAANPLRVIADGELKIPLSASVLKDKNVLVATTKTKNKKKLAKLSCLKKMGVRILPCPARSPGHADLAFVLDSLGKMGINHVICEGGPELAARLHEQKLIDEILLFVAPKLIGGRAAPGPLGGEGIAQMAQAAPVRFCAAYPVGGDLLICARTSAFAKKFPSQILGPIRPKYF